MQDAEVGADKSGADGGATTQNEKLAKGEGFEPSVEGHPYT